MKKQEKPFPKWIYKGNFGNSQRVNIYFGSINLPEVSLEHRNAPQDCLSMFVPLATAAERVSPWDRMRGFLPSCPIQNPAVWMLSAAHAKCLHLAPWFIPAGTPCSAISLWESFRGQGKKHILHLLLLYESKNQPPLG